MTLLDELEELDDATQIIACTLLYELAKRFDVHTFELDDALEVALERYYQWRDKQAY